MSLVAQVETVAVHNVISTCRSFQPQWRGPATEHLECLHRMLAPVFPTTIVWLYNTQLSFVSHSCSLHTTPVTDIVRLLSDSNVVCAKGMLIVYTRFDLPRHSHQ